MLIDTHCHLDFPEFDADREAVVEEAASFGVAYIINVSSSVEGARRALEVSARFPGVFAVVGVHPHEADSAAQEDLKEISRLAGSDKVVAVGETGLDYYRSLSSSLNQQRIFRAQIEIALERNLPLVVHCRQAQEDTLRILREYPSLKTVVHCFSGDHAFLSECLERGYYCSFTCNITYKKAGNIREYAAAVPLDRLMLETDAPYLPPEGMRGKRNVPAWVRYAAEAVASVKGEKYEQVCEVSTANAKSFFSIG
ncbi:MAG: TatD family hydrolase [Elusimicrobia bacterium]|nr:TatD family hydrolase [Elusimicrobiota bacterium]